MANTMGDHEWSHHEEHVASLGAVIDIGIGHDAQRATGFTARELSASVRGMFHDLIDGGANVLQLHAPAVRLYARRRGRHVDVGTRKDFADLGWEKLCDALDANVRKMP